MRWRLGEGFFFGGYAVAAVRPCAQVGGFATLAAKGTVGLARRKFGGFAAAWAFDGGGGLVHRLSGFAVEAAHHHFEGDVFVNLRAARAFFGNGEEADMGKVFVGGHFGHDALVFADFDAEQVDVLRKTGVLVVAMFGGAAYFP